MIAYDKILGCLVGAAAGDAMGAATEIRTRAQIHELFGGDVRTFEKPPKDTFARGSEPGQVTDDFSVAYVTARAVADNGGAVTEEVAKQALLEWAEGGEGRYLIEDDYDSEFRLAGRPIPTLQSIDRAGKVIYLNSFTKSIAPAIRISYLVLPPELMEEFRRRLGFYACTVPSFEQYTLARFLSRGYFEKHINRMKKYYRGQRDRLIAALSHASFSRQVEILEQDAGLHFLLRVRTHRPDRDLKALCAQAGIRIFCLSDYNQRENPADSHCLVVNYTGFDGNAAPELLTRLEAALKDWMESP